MARREYTLSPQCAHDGCLERGLIVCDTRRDQAAAYARYARSPWKCVRHSDVDVVLAEENPARETVLASYETDFGYPGKTHRFWAPEGRDSGGNGVCFGPGFKAFADDFPAGTRLVVSARIELPPVSDGENGEAQR